MADHPRIVLALDFDNGRDARALVECLDPRQCKLKVGKELFTREGPAFVESLVASGFDVFLDLKYHDIPNTVAAAVAAAADLGVWMVNVHAAGGSRMMIAAAESLQASGRATLLTAVTVLTSMTAEDLREVGVTATPAEQVARLARLARESGADGVVCSPWEAATIARLCGHDFMRVTPGIRPAADGDGDDQRRVMTPSQAIAAGSSYIVVGRPVTQAPDPEAALLAIATEIGDY